LTSRREFIKYISVAGGIIAVGGFGAYYRLTEESRKKPSFSDGRMTGRPKLYWFIPDGLRCEPVTFRVYEWARKGLLPNFQKVMQSGSFGYSIPVFPGHTPTNFATLLTGTTPKVHGVADGPMRIEGYPLKMVSKGGFSSIAKKVPPIWYTLEKENIVSGILSIPGSTPPEINMGVTIKGRWGGWGLDFPAINFHSAQDIELKKTQGFGNRVFYFGSELTRFLNCQPPADWAIDLPKSYSQPREIRITNWGETIYGYIYNSKDNSDHHYDSVLFSKDKQTVLANLKEGQWSNWCPVKLRWETKNDYNINTPKRMLWERDLSSITINTEVKIKVIRLGRKDSFRIRFIYNNLNKYLVRPTHMAEDIIESVGPMVDFVDSYPPQLIYFDEDKTTFLEEAQLSLDWHAKMVGYMATRTDCDVIFHSIYTPNQMLTSRWWLGYIDPESPRYRQVSDMQRNVLWGEVKKMYQQIDTIIGKIINNLDKESYLVISSDHGAVPLFKEVRLNNLFAKMGLLKFKMNSYNGEYEIDWAATRVIYLKMDNIYINPDGLGGNYKRASGPAYSALRETVKRTLLDLADENGIKPADKIVNWEDAGELDLPMDRVGDLVVANRPNYGWIEDISSDMMIFKESLKSGYKQAIIPDNVKAMWTPFLIMGPGVKRNYRISEPIRHIDQYPTIMRLLGKRIPKFVEGLPLEEILI